MKLLGTFNRKKLREAAKKILALSEGINVWCFEGEMGAGKTTLIKEIALLLGVKEEVNSPTFALVNEYVGDASLLIYHFDLHRIKSIEEAQDIGIEQYLHSGSYCFIEWPQLIEPLLPDNWLHIKIEQASSLEEDSERRTIYLQQIHF